MGGEDWKNNLLRIPYFARITAVTVFLFLPAITGFFSWTIFFIPLFVFFLLGNFEEERVYAHILPALLAGGILSLLLRSLPSFFLATSLLPVGHTLMYSARRGDPVWRSCLAGCLVLISIWFIGGIALNLFLDTNLYREAISGLDSTLLATFKMYQESGDLTPQMALQLNEAIQQLRSIIPRIFPAITVNTVVITIWLNLLLGNWLLKKSRPGPGPWPDFKYWALPEKLVWLVIAAGFALLLPAPWLRGICLNVVLIFGLIYSLQGLAVLSFLLHKWKVPVLFQVLVFSLILLQTYSVILLAVLGLIDIWFNFRKEKQIN